MTESARHFKQTTTGRKQIPISEVEKPVSKKRDNKGRYIKKKEPESLEEALTENQQPRPFIPPGTHDD